MVFLYTQNKKSNDIVNVVTVVCFISTGYRCTMQADEVLRLVQATTLPILWVGAQEDDGEGTGSNNYEQEDTQDKIEVLCCAIDQMTEDLKQRVRRR